MGSQTSKPVQKEELKTNVVNTVPTYEPTILVVGAGAAGLACATKLLDSGFRKVTMLEAERRIGGRILTVPFGDNVVDLGSQWCHGTVNNVVYNLMEGRDVLEPSGEIYVNTQSIRSNGEVVPDKIVERLKFILAAIFSDQHGQLSSYKGSFDEFLSCNYFNELLTEEYKDIDFKVAKEFFENYRKIEGTETLSEQGAVSACGLQEYWICDGDYFLNFKDKGCREFLRILIKADKTPFDLGLLEGKILFEHMVEHIIWSQNNGQVKIQCRGIHKDFVADHVVITCSLGVLKQHMESMFTPSLPEWKANTIKTLGFAKVGKIYLEFVTPFWSKGWNGFITLWRQEDMVNLAGTKHAWMLDVFGFYRVNYQPRILIGWIVGPHVVDIERMSQAEIKAGCLNLLQRFLVSWKISEPKNVVVSNWGTNPNYYGSYSYRSLETETAGTNAYSLGQPLSELVYDMSVPSNSEESSDLSETSKPPKTYKPIVLFAGEATSPHYYSTVHGAVESGWREANRLIGYYLKEL